jgi:hypothetical protein
MSIINKAKGKVVYASLPLGIYDVKIISIQDAVDKKNTEYLSVYFEPVNRPGNTQHIAVYENPKYNGPEILVKLIAKAKGLETVDAYEALTELFKDVIIQMTYSEYVKSEVTGELDQSWDLGAKQPKVVAQATTIRA